MTKFGLLLLILLAVVSQVEAQIINSGTCSTMIRTEAGDVLIGPACDYDFAAADFSVTCSGGECNVAASNNIMRSGPTGTLVDVAQLPASVLMTNDGTPTSLSGTNLTNPGTTYTDARTSSTNGVNKIAFEIDSIGNLTGTGDTNTALRLVASGGEATSGNTSGNNRPIWTTTVGGSGTANASEAFRFDSTSLAGDKPNMYALQSRVAITNSTGAVDVAYFTTANDKIYHVIATVIGRCTSSTGGCTAGQGFSAKIEGLFTNISGTLTQIGTTNVPTAGIGFQIDNLNGTQSNPLAFSISSPVLKVTATNPQASSIMTWHCRLDVEDLGS